MNDNGGDTTYTLLWIAVFVLGFILFAVLVNGGT